MIVNKNLSLKNTQISKNDMDSLFKILKSQKLNYTCKILLSDDETYTYDSKTKEKKPFRYNKFANREIIKIIIESKSCNMEYGKDCKNTISFEGYENDQTYNSLFTQIDDWKSHLLKIKRINLDDNYNLITYMIMSIIISFTLSIAYFILAMNLDKNAKFATIASITLFFLLITCFILYSNAFKYYEINIGKAKFKTYQKIFYIILSSCVLPIAIGLIC